MYIIYKNNHKIMHNAKMLMKCSYLHNIMCSKLSCVHIKTANVKDEALLLKGLGTCSPLAA